MRIRIPQTMSFDEAARYRARIAAWRAVASKRRLSGDTVSSKYGGIDLRAAICEALGARDRHVVERRELERPKRLAQTTASTMRRSTGR